MLASLDYTGTPAVFEEAFRSHAAAWRASGSFFDRFADLRGELHAVFEEIRSRGGRTQERLGEHEAVIWATWSDVEAAAERQD